MNNFNVEPWPSTYGENKEIQPRILKGGLDGRKVGAFRGSIPPMTIEPPQIHLLAERDGLPFKELILDFDKYFHVAYFDINRDEKTTKVYSPGEIIDIPLYQIHWLINPHNTRLEFTCEYSPYPWDGDIDEPEFENLSSALRFIEKRGLVDKVIQASRDI